MTEHMTLVLLAKPCTWFLWKEKMKSHNWTFDQIVIPKYALWLPANPDLIKFWLKYEMVARLIQKFWKHMTSMQDQFTRLSWIWHGRPPIPFQSDPKLFAATGVEIELQICITFANCNPCKGVNFIFLYRFFFWRVPPPLPKKKREEVNLG